MTCSRTLLGRFARVDETFPVSLPDRASAGIGELTAADFRRASAVFYDLPSTEQQWIEALRPFGAAGFGHPSESA
jgi:hypothetical protein